MASEVACHEALPQQLHAMHLCLGAATAVVSAPFSPDRATEVFRCAKGLASHDGARGRRLPRRGFLARWYDGVGTPVGDGFMALARIVGSVGGDLADLYVSRDLVKEHGQHGRVTDIATGYLDGSALQRLFIDADMYLAP